MTHSIGVLALTVALALASVPAQARENLFVGGGVINWTYSEGTVTPDASATGYEIRAGQDFLPYLGWQVNAGIGGSDNVGPGSSAVEVELDYFVSIFLRASVPVSWFRLYGLAGGTTIQVTGDPVIGPAIANTDHNLSYGAGAEVDLGDTWAVGAEYVRHVNNSVFSFTGASFFLKRHFG